MRTTYPVVVVLAIAMVAAMISMSGFWGAVGLVDDQPAASAAVNESAGDYNPNTGFAGEANTQNDGDIVGLILSGGGDAFDLLGLVNLLPNTLMWLGFPAWFANPLGWAGSILAFLGGVQFVLGRVLQ